MYLPWLGLFHKLHIYVMNLCIWTPSNFYVQDWNNRNKVRTPHGYTMLTAPMSTRTRTNRVKCLMRYTLSKGTLNDQNFWQNQHFTNIMLNHKKTPYYNDYIEDLGGDVHGQGVG